MEEQFISFETAKLAKEKGFLSRDNLVTINSDYFYLWMCELQKWLRDTHKIHITVTSISQESWQYHITKIGEKLGDRCGEDYATYEEALEDGLLEALKLINVENHA